MNVIVIVEEKDAPGFKLDGIGPFDAVKPFPDGVTETPRVDRLAGMLPMFLTVYETTMLSPGAKGPALAVAELEGRGVRSVKTT